jgi:hypothetical protein
MSIKAVMELLKPGTVLFFSPTAYSLLILWLLFEFSKSEKPMRMKIIGIKADLWSG